MDVTESIKKELYKEFKNRSTDLLNTLSSFSEEAFNAIPFEGSWTPAQVLEHLLKSLQGILKTLYGATTITERPPNEKVKAFKEVFLNFEIKMKSPESILPKSSLPLSKRSSLNDLERIITKFEVPIKDLNLAKTCTTIEFPGLGEFTRLEWIYFTVFHMQRHTHQLKKIFEIMHR